MASTSAGLLAYRMAADGTLQVLLVHPGGPFWARKDEGAWSIPKGLVEPGEAPEAAAMRELAEETGWSFEGPRHPLGAVRQKSGKVVYAWAVPGDVDPTTLVPHLIDIEWPPRSGMRRTIPEVDRADWFDLATAAVKINVGQRPLLDRLRVVLEDLASR